MNEWLPIFCYIKGFSYVFATQKTLFSTWYLTVKSLNKIKTMKALQSCSSTIFVGGLFKLHFVLLNGRLTNQLIAIELIPLQTSSNTANITKYADEWINSWKFSKQIHFVYIFSVHIGIGDLLCETELQNVKRENLFIHAVRVNLISQLSDGR